MPNKLEFSHIIADAYPPHELQNDKKENGGKDPNN